MKQTLKIFAAGCAVYVGMAACSAADTGSQRLAGAGGSSAGTASTGGTAGLSGGTGGGLLDSGLDAIADALSDVAADVVDPVDAADAAPMPTIVTVACDREYNPGYLALYAEAAFPGKLADELAHVIVVVEYSSSVEMPGYTKRTLPYVNVRDGFAAVGCGQKTGNTVTSVTFILP